MSSNYLPRVLVGILALVVSGCATWETLTFSPDRKYSDQTKNQTTQLYYINAENLENNTELVIERYLHPGPLWWAFDWQDAAIQARRAQGVEPVQRDGGDWSKGCVFLLDEIDKAESEVPNGLLEALGTREFTPLGRASPVRASLRPLLVVITTNEERALPDAFLRRCLVIRLGLPKEEGELVKLLMERGKAHFRDAEQEVLQAAADMLLADRQSAIAAQIRLRPGQAEYLDLLRIVLNLEPGKPAQQLTMLREVAEYALKKQPGAETSE